MADTCGLKLLTTFLFFSSICQTSHPARLALIVILGGVLLDVHGHLILVTTNSRTFQKLINNS